MHTDVMDSEIYWLREKIKWTQRLAELERENDTLRALVDVEHAAYLFALQPTPVRQETVSV